MKYVASKPIKVDPKAFDEFDAEISMSLAHLMIKVIRSRARIRCPSCGGTKFDFLYDLRRCQKCHAAFRVVFE